MCMQTGETFYYIVPGLLGVTVLLSVVLTVFLIVCFLNMDCTYNITFSSSSWLKSRNGKTRHHIILLHTEDHKV